MDSLQLGLHGEAPNVSLQVGSVHHPYPKDDEGDMLRLRGHQAALPPVVLLVLKHHPAGRLSGAPNACRNTSSCLRLHLQEILAISHLYLYFKPSIMGL